MENLVFKRQKSVFADTAWLNQAKLFSPVSESDCICILQYRKCCLEKVNLTWRLRWGEVNGLNMILLSSMIFQVDIFLRLWFKIQQNCDRRKRGFEKMDPFICVAPGLLFLGFRMHGLFLYLSEFIDFSHVKFWLEVWKCLIFRLYL